MTESPSASDLLRQASDLLKQGKRNEARDLIARALKLAPNDPNAWYLAAVSVSDPQKKLDALNQALRLRPDHPQARKLFERIEAEQAVEELAATLDATPAAPPVASLPVTAPPPQRAHLPWLPLAAVAALTMATMVCSVLVTVLVVTDRIHIPFIAALLASPTAPVTSTPTALPGADVGQPPRVVLVVTATPPPTETPRPTRTPIPPTLTPTPTERYAQRIDLPAALQRIVYDRDDHTAYGLDAANKRLYIIDMGSRHITESVDLTYVPSDACVHRGRNSLFIVNLGSTFVVELDLQSKRVVRELAWQPGIYDSASPDDGIHMHIHCQENRLFLVDASWSPVPWIIPLDEGVAPISFFPGAAGNGEGPGRSIGDFVFTDDPNEFYYWEQYGWSAGWAGTNVYRVRIEGDKLDVVGESRIGYPAGSRDPRNTPIFYDAASGRVLAKVFVLNASNLEQIYFTFFYDDYYKERSENIYAVDWQRHHAASQRKLYSLDTYRSVADLPFQQSDEMFFDRDGVLYMLVNADLALYYMQP